MSQNNKDKDVIEWIPVLNEDISIVTNDNHVIIVCPLNKPLNRFFQKIKLNTVKSTKTTLDEYSSLVMSSIDGNRNIGDITDLLIEKYPDEKNDIHERLLIFLNMISKDKKWITFK